MNDIRYHIYRFISLVLIGLVINACGGSSTGSDGGNGGNSGGGNQQGSTQYSLSVDVSPNGTGSVDPSSGTYDEGGSVDIKATANNGYAFSKWTGDKQSTNNPITITMDQDYSLTANFVDATSEYLVTMSIADSLNTAGNRKLGQKQSASDGFNAGEDVERPNQDPPGNALIAYFKTDGHKLLEDYRASDSRELTWNLQLKAGAGDSLSLSWSINQTKLNGTLKLQSSDGKINMDMTNSQNLDIRAMDYDSLLIHYQFSN